MARTKTKKTSRSSKARRAPAFRRSKNYRPELAWTTAGICRAWQKVRDLTVSEWADAERIIDDMQPEPGRWKTSRAPYLREIQDSFSDRSVEEITIIKSAQTGGTEALFNMLGYAIAEDPGTALYVMPTEQDIDAISAKRVKPMIDASPALAELRTGREADLRGKLFELMPMLVKFAWSNSASSLASVPCRYVLLDEVDKYPKFSGNEADPLSLARVRTSNYWNRKIVKNSTPTTADGYIHQEWLVSSQERYHVPCPHCSQYQPLAFGQVRWPEDERDPAKVEELRLAWYECVHCEKAIEESSRAQMLAEGVWCPDGCTVTPAGKIKGKLPSRRHRGFHLSKLYSPWVSWSQTAAEFLRSKDDVRKLMNFVNSWLGEIWSERSRQTTPAHVESAIAGYERGTVPDDRIRVLTAGVDVQQGSFWFVIRGWGARDRSWLVDYGQVGTWEELDKKLFGTGYKRPRGDSLSVRLACVDSGYRAPEVYDFCRERIEVARPIKGQQAMTAAPTRATPLDKDVRGRGISDGLMLWNLDTTFFKDKLARLMHAGMEEGSERVWFVPDGVGSEYKTQVTAEHKIQERNRRTGQIKTVWRVKPGSGANHLGDCEVYAAAAAEMMHVFLWTDDDVPSSPARSRKTAARGGGQWTRGGRGGPWVK